MTLLPSRRSDVIGFPVLIVVLAVFPLVAPIAWVNVGVFALIYGIAAIGLTMLMGLAGQVSLGQAAFFAIGAYTQAILVTRYAWPAALAAILAVTFAAAAAAVLGLVLLRLRGHYLALGTLGLGIIVTVIANEWQFTGATSGIYGVPKPEINGRVYDSPDEFFWLLIPVVVICLVIARNIVSSRTGRALSAVNDSEVAAESLGVDTFRLRLQVFALSAAYAGLAGVFYAHWLAVVNPNAAGFPLSVQFLLMSVLGGLATVWGAVVGAFLVQFLDEAMNTIIPQLIPGATGEVQLLGFGVVLVLVVILLPGGLHQLGQRTAAALRSRTGGQGGGTDGRASRAGTAGGSTSSASPGDEPALFARSDTSPRPEPGTVLLRVHGLTKRFGGVVAVREVSLDVRAGEILALIGPNGAGKTTCFDMISGVLGPSAGSVTLAGDRIDGAKPHVFARHRATRTFQNLQVFTSASVLGNVMVGRHLRSRAGMLSAALFFPARREEQLIAEHSAQAVRLVGLEQEAGQNAVDLPFGRQRLVELARALALEPDLLLLDEPMAGLSGAERRDLGELLRRLRAEGMGIVLVEHDVEAVLALADRVAVLDEGELIALGSPDEVRADPAVVAAYLGVEDESAEADEAARDLSRGAVGGQGSC